MPMSSSGLSPVMSTHQHQICWTLTGVGCKEGASKDATTPREWSSGWSREKRGGDTFCWWRKRTGRCYRFRRRGTCLSGGWSSVLEWHLLLMEEQSEPLWEENEGMVRNGAMLKRCCCF